MTKLPRDVSGEQFCRKLVLLGYYELRQTGSHIILETRLNGMYHVSVPRHQPLQVGTLGKLLREIADHHALTPGELLRQLKL